MKNLSSILIFVITLLQFNPSTACTCAEPFFCGSVDNTTSVLQVIVIEKYNENFDTHEYADVKIIGTLQNEIIEDTITIAGVLQTSCDELIPSSMEIGDTLLINFPELIFPYFDAKHSAFQLISCELYVLQLSAGIVTGKIQPNLNSMNYDDFVANLGECNDFLNSTADLNHLEKEITISPNPFSENVTIDLENLATSNISIELFSAAGQKITYVQNFQQYNYKLSMSSFPKGIYFVKIQYRNESIMKKIAKL